MIITKLFILGFISFITTNIYAGNIIIPQVQHKKSIKAVKPAPSINNAKAVADGPTADPAIMDQIKKDWDTAMSGALIPNLDDSMSWAGGTLTRIAPGKMEYVNKRNGTFSQILDSNTDIADLAKKSGDVNAAWIAQYGVDLGGGMGFSPNTQAQQEGNKIAVNHTYTHGVSSTYTKDKPYDLGFGIGAFNDKGNTKFALKGQTLDLNQLMATNEYKALTGVNMVYSAPESNSNKKEFPVEPSSTNQNDFNKSLLEQKKAQLAQALGAVEKIKTQITQLEALIKAMPTTAIVSNADNNQNEMVLIGTANNGTSKIYSIKQNSWDTKYGFKIRIIPDKPNVSAYYDLTIPSSDSSRTLVTDPAYLLTQIPSSYNVDMTVDGKPTVIFDKTNNVGMWVPGASSIVCSSALPPLPQPEGSCSTIGEQKKYVSNAGFANNLRPEEKKCIDAGLDKVQIVVEFSCQPDLYLNKAGR